MADIKDILSNLNSETTDEELLKYLSGHLSANEEHDLEAKMLDSDFIYDAVEGLEAFSSKEKLNDYVKQLNANLNNQLDSRKKKKEKRKIKGLNWLMAYVIIILLLCALGYAVIHLYNKKKVPGNPPPPPQQKEQVLLK